jgi:hypothetical protein
MTSSPHTTASSPYKNAENNVTHCGPIIYSLIGSATGLTYNAATREFTFAPLTFWSEITVKIRAASSTFPLNYAETDVKVEALLNCDYPPVHANQAEIKIS